MNELSLEKFAFYSYVISVAFSPLGPVIHYSGWGLTLIALLILKQFYKKRIIDVEDKNGRRIFALLAFFLIWTAVAGLFHFESFFAWGRNVSLPLELFTGCVFAVRLLNSDKRRSLFLRILVPASVFILAGNLARTVGIIPDFPNHSLINVNGLGNMVMDLLPLVVCAVLWNNQMTVFVKAVILMLFISVIILSVSSGMWLAAGCCMCVLLYFGIKHKKISLKLIVCTVLLAAATLMASIMYEKDAASYVMREISQISAIKDGVTDRLTTNRYSKWVLYLLMAKDRPFLGYAGQDGPNVYARYYTVYHDKYHLAESVNTSGDAENICINLLCLGGIPALAAFLLALFFAAFKSLRLANNTSDENLAMWGVASFTLIVAILSMGVSSDVFQGRRDISVIVWCCIGILIALPEKFRKNKAPDINDTNSNNHHPICTGGVTSK